jgi:hypothetical protein
VPTKPKVEILPFEKAQFIPIRNFEHFRRIARRYWEHEIYPNHILPELAPYCPFIHVSKTGEFQLHNVSDYMLGLAHSHAYQSSADVLRDSPMPQALFEQMQSICQQNLIPSARSLKHGKELSLLYCQQYREKRWHLKRETIKQFRGDATKVNMILARVHDQQLQKEKTMSTITIDNIEYALEDLSKEAKAQIQSIQFVDEE